MEKRLPIKWDKKAKENLDKIYHYIAEDSESASRHVKRELIKLAQSLNDFPKKYSKEEFLKDEPEDYRSVSKWSYKIIFEITENSLIIIDIFHTKQDPSSMKK